MADPQIGISGFASYLPRYRVPLDAWCRWSGDNWDKVRAVVGSGFRMRGPDENAYTMAATAVLRLIRQYDLDPGRIGFLGLGTESSTDNSAGAVIVKGMVNRALTGLGLPPLARSCEVPEFKHACLGGVYAMKAAARYLALDGRGRHAIVVCSDVAEYARATSGEPTQGAGAVAMLIEESPRMLGLELMISGSASDYRGPDFRKPFLRFMQQSPSAYAQPRDFPVFNGKYSTTCYIDEALAAMRDLFARLKEAGGSSLRAVATRPSRFMRDLSATFLHRPYQRMAETGLIMSYLLALAIGDGEDLAELRHYAEAADVDVDALVAELTAGPDVYRLVEDQRLSDEIYPLAVQTARAFRGQPRFDELMTGLGTEEMQEVGNLYTASLPAWMAAGIEEAARTGVDLTDSRILTLGYGSGDAAEAIPMIVMPDWRAAAERIGFTRALADPVDLDADSYAALHDGQAIEGLPAPRDGVFYIDRIGAREAHFDDSGIEYYRYHG
ncbi:MAG: hydroxymethylglutaryl-CoA synthase [Gammaproteobacteria bacterium]|nr:hydroxymethylglutaryl-CoA synthase [Gammaproteobacteria bacterium]|tara:strand:+ start:472 stop:1965 length:1494 start_codon:yes stop_codon:yes gene_type:complete